jgi:hypothetical protein
MLEKAATHFLGVGFDSSFFVSNSCPISFYTLFPPPKSRAKKRPAPNRHGTYANALMSRTDS